jgi:hypothetical protein
MKNLSFLVLLSSSLLFQSCDNSIPRTSDSMKQDTTRKSDFFKKFSIKEQQEDLKLLKEALEKIHPGLYWHVTKEDFEKEYTTLLNGITSEKTAYQYAFYIRNLFAKIRCTHTGVVGLSEEQEKFKDDSLPGFPFTVKAIDNKLYIKDNFTEDHAFDTGSEIIAVNGIKTGDLLKEYIKKVHVDGFNKEAEIFTLARHFFLLTEYKFDFPSSYSLEVLSSNGTFIKKNVIGLPWSVTEKNYYIKHPKEESQSLEIIDCLKTAIITFNTFDDTTWLTFLEPSFKTIKDKKIQNLVIDVRKNPGGADLYGSSLYAYLALAPYNYYNHLEMCIKSVNEPVFEYGFIDTTELKDFIGNAYLKKMSNGNYVIDKEAHPITDEAPLEPDENSFKGKVFILTSHRTSSGGSEFCGIARFQKRAIFIGQETGGGYCGNTSGFDFILNLPNTKIQICIPTIRYYAAIENCQSEGGVKPDYEIKPNVADLDSKIDREMNLALDLIRKQQ